MRKFLVVMLAQFMFVGTALADATFVRPNDDQSIRANNGDVVVIVEADEEYQLLIDGNSVKPATITISDHVAHVIPNVDRGTHVLELVTDSGTETITVHVLRVHK